MNYVRKVRYGKIIPLLTDGPIPFDKGYYLDALSSQEL